MPGKWFFCSLVAIFSLLSSFSSYFYFIPLFLFFLFSFFTRYLSRRLTLIFILCSVLFFIRGYVASYDNGTDLRNERTDFTLTFTHGWVIDGDRLSAQAIDQLSNEKLVFTYYIPSKEEKDSLEKVTSTGLICNVMGKLETPQKATNFHSFDYQEYLQRKGIHWQIQTEQFDLRSCQMGNTNIVTQIWQLREKGIQYVSRYFPSETAPLVNALVYGDRSQLDETVETAYQRLGIIHLLAISGMHVSLLAGMLLFVGLRLGVTRQHMLMILVGLLPIYGILAGGTPSVIRAVAMLMFAALFKIFLSAMRTQDVLCIVFVCYLLMNPFILYDVGFQLSFTVTYVLLLSSYSLLKRRTSPIRSLFVISFICQLAATPILLYSFYEISIFSLVANILFVPIFSFVILPLFLFLLAYHMIVGTWAWFPIQGINTLLERMNDLSLTIADYPQAVLTLGRPSLWLILLYLIAINLFFLQWEKREGRKNFLLASIAPFFVFFIHYLTPYFYFTGEVSFIDVGQGDSIFIRLPHNRGNYLIDTGGVLPFDKEEWQERTGAFDPGEDIVVPFLKSKGIRKIDKLILTHGDSDHMGGAPAVLSMIEVSEILLPITNERSALETEIIKIAHTKQVNVRQVSAGVRWRMKAEEFQILMPFDKTANNKNDGSIVLYAVIGGLTWLFTGDLEESGEAKLVNKYERLSVDVLKVGHHGSKTSTTEKFLDGVKPKLAVISVGRNNRFGHPTEEVLQRLKNHQIPIVRTDRHGGISYVFFRGNGTFSTVLP
ncbi:DNA internalization-related competence protein ComEC/Rec2 [Cytobacillus kochii]|uniref:DNA internalization-related competence protein ComEC/Rec2 n=1 Tax=Cytobacillus kochii TaxID=859143 RepID=UPI00203E65E0|nr:DNA internalization-related competence protein ComEC/Rec2 [Cytobacillus kochii]